MNRIGTAIMKVKESTSPAVALCARDGAVHIETSGIGAERLTVDEARALRRGLSRAIREAEAQSKEAVT